MLMDPFNLLLGRSEQDDLDLTSTGALLCLQNLQHEP